MDAKQIVNLALYLKREGATNDSFKIAHNLGIKVKYCKFKKDDVKGYMIRPEKDPIILINQNFDYCSQKVICAHELGHAILHKEYAINHFKGNVCPEFARYEYEANLFAVALLFNQDDLEIKIAHMSNYQLKSLLDFNIV